MPDPRIGTFLAGHRIDAVIGRGGASVVYLAEHVALGRKVALKVLTPHFADEDAFRERFVRESRIAAGLDHPNIVTVFDAGEADDVFYISMRYVDGADLGRVLRSDAVLDTARTVLLLSQVASALDAAHAQGLVHRDIKPGNILVARDRSTGLERAYLSDFGLTKRIAASGGLTETGQFVGTVDYVAPEQIAGEPVDGRTDVYSLGCVLYQCVTGDVPFGGETDIATIYRHLNDEPPAPSRSFELLEPLDGVVMKALAKSKEDRYPTAGGLVEAARVALVGIRDTPTVVRPVVRRDPTVSRAPKVESADAGQRRSEDVKDAGVTTETRRGPRPARRRSMWVPVASAALVAIALLVWAVLSRPPAGERSEGGSPGSGPSSPSEQGSPAAATERPPAFAWAAMNQPLVFGGAGSQAVLDATRAGPIVVGVGHVPGTNGLDDGAVWLLHGRRWDLVTPRSMGTSLDERLISVTAFQDALIAGGWDGNVAGIWASTDDGEHWQVSNSDSLRSEVRQRVRSFASLGGTLFAVGGVGPSTDQDAAVWTSSDGLDWKRTVDPDLQAPGDQQMWSVERVGGRLIGVGYSDELGTEDAAVWVFEPGKGWSRVEPRSLRAEGDQSMLDIATGTAEQPVVAVGCSGPALLGTRCDTSGDDVDNDAAVWTSDDGRSWTRVTNAPGLGGSGSQVILTTISFKDTFIAAGYSYGGADNGRDAGVWTSFDGTDWVQTRQRMLARPLYGPNGQSIRAIIENRGVKALLAFGVTSEGALQDEDARVWSASLLMR